MLWRVAAIVALLWPSRLSGILDGAPLDTLPEALLLGPVAVALAWLHPSALRSRLMRAAVIAILVLKIGAAFSVQQEGWCLTFTPPKPMVRDSTGKPHAWDIRADWRVERPGVLGGDDTQLSGFVRAAGLVLQPAAARRCAASWWI